VAAVSEEMEHCGDIEVILTRTGNKAFVRVSAIAAVIQDKEGGPSTLIFTGGGLLAINGSAEIWRRKIRIIELELTSR
jgi:hypothetical protein